MPLGGSFNFNSPLGHFLLAGVNRNYTVDFSRYGARVIVCSFIRVMPRNYCGHNVLVATPLLGKYLVFTIILITLSVTVTIAVLK